MKFLSFFLWGVLSCSFQLFAGTHYPPDNPPSDTSEVIKAHSLHKQVVVEERTIESFDETLAVTLPLGIKKKIGNTENIIVLETMKFTPDGATVTAYMSSEIPESEKRIALKGKDINFSPGGFTGGARLELLENVDIPLGEKMTLIVKGEENKTFVEWDCHGYKSMGLHGNIEFSRKMLLPEGSDGKIIKDENVKVYAGFVTQLEGWDDLLVEVDISPFQHKELKDFSFTVNSAVFDFSELANSPSMIFPKGYQSIDFIDDDTKMWKGFFLKDLIIRLPGNLSKDTVDRSTIEAHNLIIDNMGVSGLFAAKNVIPNNEGRLGKWPFSIDQIAVSIAKNQMDSCGFMGTITIPPLSDTTTLNYEAFIDPGNNYTFLVETEESIKMDMWAADLRLDPNSYVDIRMIEGKFKPKAVLNGELSVKNNETEIAGIEFEQLEVSPEIPFIKVESFSFGSENSKQKFANYPINITNIGLINQDNRTGLKFDMTLNLVKSKDAGFTGKTGLTLFAKMYEENERQNWKYAGFEVSKIRIDINNGVFSLKGKAAWFKDDPVYGNGFSGNIEAEFKALPRLTATAIFGNINGMRYWYADAMVNLDKGIPLFGGVNLYGFGGGAYYHMNQLGWDEKAIGTIGKTASGIIYKPDENIFLGLKASVNLGLESKTIFNSDLTFEMAFNKYAGVDRIIFRGNGYFMTTKEKSGVELSILKDKCKDISKGKDPNIKEKRDKNPARSSLYAFVNLDFDFKNDVVHGNLGTYINIGDGDLQGIGPGGKAGQAVIHFAKDEWYIHIGTPTNRIGVKALKFAELNAYFMMGTYIPASPPPPAKVSEILGGINLNYMANENALGEGKGIGFGAGLQFNTGRKEFKPFYAVFDAGMGFDVMMKNYGNVSCKGLAEPLGINGWYANGQVWAYIEGAIGIRIDWRFLKGNYEILRVGAASVLQAKMPNPFWMHGVVGGRYSILGGLVSGNCRFDLTIGEECEMLGEGSAVQGLEVIAETTPNSGSTDVNVFNAAQAVFNMPIEKTFELVDLDDQKKSFKIVLDHFKIIDSGKEVQGSLEWNAENDVVAFNSFEILPPKKELKLEVQVSFKEKVKGAWKTITANGQKITEHMESSFTTGEAPDYIPHNNVTYSYPLIRQFNYYQNETDIGYIQLDKGQAYLFKPGAEWNQTGRFTDKSGNKLDFSFNYIVAEKKVNFTRPTNLITNTLYSFELLNVPKQSQAKIDKNVVAKVEKKDLKLKDQSDGEVSTLEITTKDAQGTLNILDEKSIFSTHFRTSMYKTLSEKIDGLTKNEGYRYPLRALVHLISIGIYSGETFEKYETIGTNEIDPLIKFTNTLGNKNWYKSIIYPNIYKNYPNPLEITNRQINPVGVPPFHTVAIVIDKGYSSLTDDNILNGSANTNIGYAAFQSKLVHYAANDYYDLQAQACNKYYGVSKLSSNIKYLIEHSFSPVKNGDYKFKVQYILPGINSVSSTKILTIKLK